MDVVWEMSLKAFLEVPAQAEVGVEDADVPAPGLLGYIHEDLYDDLWGGKRQTYKELCHPGDGSALWQDQIPGGKEAANLLPSLH